MMDWKLYYGDRTTYSSEDGLFADAPAFNVAGLGVAMPAPMLRQIRTGHYYILPLWMNTPHAPEPSGLLDALRQQGDITLNTYVEDLSLADLEGFGVKLGRMYDEDEWASIWAWMVEDADKTWGV